MPVIRSGVRIVPAHAAQPREITLNSFKGSNVWPIWVAQKQGFFAKEGLAIKNVYTANSVAQMTGLIKGEFDLVTTAFDNIIAYAEGEGAPQAPKNADLMAFMGGNNGALSLIARPGIKNARELAGQDLAVDAISTGFSFVLQDMLARTGVAPGGYKLVPFGATGARYMAMQEGKAKAAVLTPPLSLVAVGQGYVQSRKCGRRARRLPGLRRRHSPRFCKEQSRGGCRLHPRLSRRPRLAAGARQQAGRARRSCALKSRTPTPVADENYALMVANPQGFDPGGKLDAAGAREVLALRRKYGPQGKTDTDIGRFIDESYFRARGAVALSRRVT